MYVVLAAVVIDAPVWTFHEPLVVMDVPDTIVEPSALAEWQMAPQVPDVPWNTAGAVAPGLIFKTAAELRPPATVDPYAS